MNTVSMHAAKIAQSFPGFESGIHATHRDNSDKRVAILTVFNRIIDQDSGLRVKVWMPVSDVDFVDGRVNLLGRAVEKITTADEIVITQVHP
jgi:hypothetical protein